MHTRGEGGGTNGQRKKVLFKLFLFWDFPGGHLRSEITMTWGLAMIDQISSSIRAMIAIVYL